jgi:hypothetical protein
VHRAEANGGDVTFQSVEELREAYTSGALHPGARARRPCSAARAPLRVLRRRRGRPQVQAGPVDPFLTRSTPAPHALTTGDLKPSLSKALNQILQPVRDHFVNNPEAAALLKQVRAGAVARGWGAGGRPRRAQPVARRADG